MLTTKIVDPLVLHGCDESDVIDKSMKKGIDAIKNQVFLPSRWAPNWAFGGHGQTIMAEVKHVFRTVVYGEHQYSKRELFTLSDGGKIYLDFEGNNFLKIDNQEDSLDISSSPSSIKETEEIQDITNPVLFITPGLTDESQKGMVVNMVDQAQSEGYDVVVINYRGLAGASLYTPRLYSANNVEDHLEAMTYVYEKYCKPYNR